MVDRVLDNGSDDDAFIKHEKRRDNGLPNILVIGASHAGITFADKIRQNGFNGDITLIDQQKGGPLERPPLSKKFLFETSDKPNPKYLLKRGKWYKEQKILLNNDSRVLELDRRAKCVVLDGGQKLGYDKLILATGAIPRAFPGSAGISNIFVLRQPDHAVAIRNAARHANKAIIIGGGYIGLEIAASFRQMGIEVYVIELEERLLARVASPGVAKNIADLHSAKGVLLYMRTGVVEVLNDDGAFSGVALSDGTKLTGDLLVVGIGVIPDSKLALQAGVETENSKGGAIMVDECQRTSDPNIFAIGDVAMERGSSVRIESVDNAQSSAARAAATILGNPLPITQAPWFWSDQYDANLQSVGIVPINDSQVYQVVRKGVRERGISFWSYCKANLVAVEAIRCPEDFLLGKKYLDEKISPDPKLIGDPQFLPER